MKKFQLILLSLALAAFITACGGNSGHSHDDHGHNNETGQTTDTQSKPHGEGKEYTSAYVCPMHCEGSGGDTEGACPKCGMDYVKNEEHTADGHSH